jgi:hypothetical protein
MPKFSAKAAATSCGAGTRNPPELLQFFLKCIARQFVDGGKRFIEQEQIGLQGHGAGERKPHAHTARQLMRIGVGKARQSHQLHGFFGALAAIRRCIAFKLHQQFRIAENRAPRQQGGILKNESCLGIACPRTSSSAWREQSGDEAQQR